MKRPERFPPDDPREWMNRARSNLALAKNRVAEAYLEDLCFEAQQAAEKAVMEALKILESKHNLNWDYDGEADVLYISVASPKPAVGIDIGEGVVIRYDEAHSRIVGLSIVGLREKMLRELSSHTR